MKKLVLKTFVLTTAVYLAGCSQGSSNTNSSQSNTTYPFSPVIIAQAPLGPIPYQYIINSYNTAAGNNSNNSNSIASKLVKNQGSSLTPTCGLADDGVGAVTGALSFVPVIGPLFGAIGALADLIGGVAGSSCLQQQINTINNTLNYQQNEITQLQIGVSYLANEFAEAYYASSVEISALAGYNYQSALQYMIGNGSGEYGLFGNTMINLAFWNNDTGHVNSPVTYSELGNADALFVINPSGTDSTLFQNNLQNILGSAYNKNECRSESGTCYQTVFTNSQTALILSLDSLYTSLAANINQYMQVSNRNSTNVVNLINGYDITLNAIFIQSLNYLQQAYMLEYLVNVANYEYLINNYDTSNPNSIPLPVLQSASYGNVPYTLFNYNALYENLGTAPSKAQIVSAYNNAQASLALMYTAYANNLYSIILSYTLSDSLIGNQQFPPQGSLTLHTAKGSTVTVPGNINYNSLINTATESITGSITLQRPLALLGLSSLNVNNLPNANYMITQYILNNVNQCLTSLDNYNNSTESPNFIDMINSPSYSCNSVYGNVNSSESYSYMGNYLPAQTLGLYYAAESNSVPAQMGVFTESPANLSYPQQALPVDGPYAIGEYTLSGVYYNNHMNLTQSFAVPNFNSPQDYNNYNFQQIGPQYEANISPGNFNNIIPDATFNVNPISFNVNPSGSNNTINSYLVYTFSEASNNTYGQLQSFNYNNTAYTGAQFSSFCITADICDTTYNTIYYTLPDGSPILLAIEAGITNPKSEQNPVSLFYSPNYAGVTCDGAGNCTTQYGNTFYIWLTTISIETASSYGYDGWPLFSTAITLNVESVAS